MLVLLEQLETEVAVCLDLLSALVGRFRFFVAYALHSLKDSVLSDVSGTRPQTVETDSLPRSNTIQISTVFEFQILR